MLHGYKKNWNYEKKTGIKVRSASVRGSLTVVVLQKSHPDEPPRRRSCVACRSLNSCQPPVTKAHLKANDVLILIPLLKIDEMYGRLNGSCIYSTFDMKSSYHDIELSRESQPKSTFVTPMGKLDLTHVPFGLAYAPAYFQGLASGVLIGLDSALRYLDDILVFSSYIVPQLKHLKILFQR